MEDRQPPTEPASRSTPGGIIDPLVSIIIPVYGTEDYLERCVRSVTGQTYQNLEIILVDDGSPDRCPTMCDEYAREDSRVTVIHQANAGQGVARNHGLDVCTGDYIMFVDSDDYIRADMVAGMVQAAVEQHADLVLCGWQVLTGNRVLNVEPYPRRMRFSAVDLMREYLSGSYPNAGPSSKLFGRAVIGDTRFPAIRAREDVYIMHELLGAVSCAVYVPEAYYIQYRRAGSTEMSAYSKAKLVTLEVNDRLVSYIDRQYPSLSSQARHLRARRFAWALREIRTSGSFSEFREDYLMLRTRILDDIAYLSERAPAIDTKELWPAASDSVAFKLRCQLSRIKHRGLALLDGLWRSFVP